MTFPAPTSKHVSASLLLPTQLVFNVGFYAVVPFLAFVMSEDLGLSATAVGIVLGARTFSQQGMFLLGGVIADRWGPRRSILMGCIVRATGYLGLAFSDSFWPFLLSAVLTGIGGAFFSPAVEGLIGTLDRARTTAVTPGTFKETGAGNTNDPAAVHGTTGVPEAESSNAQPARQRNLFAWLVLFGEIGAVTGPLLGIALQPFGFALVAVTSAALFLVVGITLRVLLPEYIAAARIDSKPEAEAELTRSHARQPFACLLDHRFVFFAALFSVNLLAYNQLYFSLPLELQAHGAGAGSLAALFTIASVLTIALQLPISALATRLGPGTALRAGFTCVAASFLAVALLGSTGMNLAPGLPVMTGPIVFVVLLTVGHMLVGPAGMQQVHRFAGQRSLGAYYGLLASCGGIAVLVGNSLTGVLRDTLGGAAGWALLILLATFSAALLPRFLPTAPARPAPPARSSSRVLPPVLDQKVQP
ncbi:MFS transporter [Arthrobacter ruber]|uniref:MFS transporter n=1 Tax=Arthrobacter ruber TaxID=1258893 RepID=UPI000CF49F90|nr:MFS transporter [Arthrobacter ruber]